MIDDTKPIIVGQFFEELALQIFGGELWRNDDCDIYLRDYGLAIEAKGSGSDSSRGMRLHISQINDYKKKCHGFPFDHGWYVFFPYRNKSLPRRKVKGEPTTELARHKAEPDIHRYLASAIQWGLLVDLSIVRKWLKIMPHSTKSIRSHPGLATVDIHCKRHLYPLCNGGLTSRLEELGLRPRDYTVLSGNITTVVQPEMQFNFFHELTSYEVKFPMTAIVRNEQARMAKQIFAERGFELHSSHAPTITAA